MSTNMRQRRGPPRRSMRSDGSLDRDQRFGSRSSSSLSHGGVGLGMKTNNDMEDCAVSPKASKPISLPAAYKARHFRKQFSTSTLVKRKEVQDTASCAGTATITSAQPCMSFDKLSSLSNSMKSLESLNFNLHNQAKKLEQSIQSLANVPSNDPLFPTKMLSEPSSADEHDLDRIIYPRIKSKPAPKPRSSKSETPAPPNIKSPAAKKGKTKEILEKAADGEFPIFELTFTIPAPPKKRSGKKKKEKVQMIDDEGLVVKSAHSSADKEAHSKLVAAKSQTTLATSQESLASDSKNQPSVEHTASCCSTSGHDSKHSNITAFKRFISQERPRREQIDSLTDRQRECLALLRQHWEVDHEPISRHMYLRFARYCRFDLRKGQGQLSRFDVRYLSLTATQLEPQLLTQTLFPVPGLKSIKGHSILYARPAMHNPLTTNSQTITDNLAYVLLTMIEKEDAATNGIGLLANMNGCSMANFSVESCLNFMKMLQGGVPARVRLVLIVNPPGWFGKLWKVMKPMLHPTFQRKIQIIPERMLSAYLAPNYPSYLPTDMAEGTVDATQLVKDFITYRKHVEAKKSWLTML